MVTRWPQSSQRDTCPNRFVPVPPPCGWVQSRSVSTRMCTAAEASAVSRDYWPSGIEARRDGQQAARGEGAEAHPRAAHLEAPDGGRDHQRAESGQLERVAHSRAGGDAARLEHAGAGRRLVLAARAEQAAAALAVRAENRGRRRVAPPAAEEAVMNESHASRLGTWHPELERYASRNAGRGSISRVKWPLARDPGAPRPLRPTSPPFS